MVVGAVVCELTDGFLWFVCGLYVGILRCPLSSQQIHTHCSLINFLYTLFGQKSVVNGDHF